MATKHYTARLSALNAIHLPFGAEFGLKLGNRAQQMDLLALQVLRDLTQTEMAAEVFASAASLYARLYPSFSQRFFRRHASTTHADVRSHAGMAGKLNASLAD